MVVIANMKGVIEVSSSTIDVYLKENIGLNLEYEAIFNIEFLRVGAS